MTACLVWSLRIRELCGAVEPGGIRFKWLLEKRKAHGRPRGLSGGRTVAGSFVSVSRRGQEKTIRHS